MAIHYSNQKAETNYSFYWLGMIFCFTILFSPVCIFAQTNDNEVYPDAGQGSPKPVFEIIGKDTIYYMVDAYASFPGGYDSLKRFVNKHYTELSSSEIGTTSLYIRFHLVVGKDGGLTPSSPQAKLSPLDEACLKIIMAMPKWNPARYNQKVVTSKVFLFFRFSNYTGSNVKLTNVDVFYH